MTKDNIGTSKGPLEDKRLLRQYRVKYMSMKGEEQENNAMTEEDERSEKSADMKKSMGRRSRFKKSSDDENFVD